MSDFSTLVRSPTYNRETPASCGDPVNKAKSHQNSVSSVRISFLRGWVVVVSRHGCYVVIYLKTATWMSLG